MEEPLQPRFLDVATVRALHADQIARYGGASGLLQPEGLESAVVAPQNLWRYNDDADIFDLAACYCSRIALSHPFEDGNKRAALATALKFLAVNGLDPAARSEIPSLFQISDQALASAVIERIGKTISETELASLLFLTGGPSLLIRTVRRRLEGEGLFKKRSFSSKDEMTAFHTDWIISTHKAVAMELCQKHGINPNRLRDAIRQSESVMIGLVSIPYQAEFGMTMTPG